MQIKVFKLVLVLVAAISYRIRTNNLQSNTICFDFSTRWQRKIKFLDFQGQLNPMKQEAQM